MRLYEIIEPEDINDIVGQEHLLGDNTPLRKMIDKGEFESLIFVGPPGTGKTTVAKLIGKKLSLPFYRLHGAATSVNEIKNITESSKHYGRPSIIFIDEVHRFSKTQQDLLLKVIDEKHSYIIGASTENPYFSLTPAMRSRSFIFEFKALNEDALSKILNKATFAIMEKYGVKNVECQNREYFIQNCGGDARRMLKLFETAASLGEIKGSNLFITVDKIEELTQYSVYSKDEHYDLLSAMIKSIRGSDPDAALVWCFKLINCGFSPEEIFRRLYISASEDIGNAYPDAVTFVNSAFNGFLNVGVPEGYIILAHAVTFLASCPKSNRSYEAYKRVKEYLKKNDPYPPANIRHNPKGYKYPFETGEFVKQTYFEGSEKFYSPSEYGFEIKIRDRLKRLWGENEF